MKNNIKDNINNLEYLEVLYSADRKGFEKEFFKIYPDISDNKIADFWKTRLEYGKTKGVSINTSRKEILFLIASCVVTILLIQSPKIISLNSFGYQFNDKYAGAIVLFGLSLFAVLRKGTFNPKQILISLSIFAVSAIYINLLPSFTGSDSVTLAYVHFPLMLWCLYGVIFIDFDIKDRLKRIDYIKYNGDLAVLGAIILIAGALLTGITIEMFSSIELSIEQFYSEYIIVWGLVSVPIVATYIILNFPNVTSKIAPIIANIFSPLVLITLIVFVIGIIMTGKDPYSDREFLLIFNVMLLGVAAIVVFSISGTSINRRQRFNEFTLLTLTVVALIVDLVALSAIIYRLGEFGYSPNRVAVLGSNLLIFGNLLLVMIDLYKVNFKNREIKQVELTIANYLPVYAIWTVFVVFVLPWIFWLR